MLTLARPQPIGIFRICQRRFAYPLTVITLRILLKATRIKLKNCPLAPADIYLSFTLALISMRILRHPETIKAHFNK